MKAKKVLAVIMAAAMTMGVMAGCGTAGKTASEDAAVAEGTKESVASAEGASETTEKSDLAGTKITFLNSKGEIQAAMEEVAGVFEEETGIEVEILACGTGESPYTKVTTAYNAGTAPTMAMLDPTDVIALSEEYALDLSGEKWIAECEDQVTKTNGKVYGFPFCIEGRGLIYNKTVIEDTLGREFDPQAVNSYDALKALLEELKAAGMEKPVVISKEDWSLGNHQLGFIYDVYDGTTPGSAELIGQLKNGSIKTADYERFGQFMDTFDLLMEYNINGADPLGALYDQDPIFLVDGDAAFWANGCWAWPNLEEAGASKEDEYGFISMVFGNDSADFANTKIQSAPTKLVMIDAVQADEQQIAAAKEFLNWLVYSETGQKMLVETIAVIPACSNNANVPLDPLGKDIQMRMKEGRVYASGFVAPSDHWSELGVSMQKYLAGESTREQLAEEVDAYWAAQK